MVITSLNISTGGIPKNPIHSCLVTKFGLFGDGHNHPKHGGETQAVSLLDQEILESLKEEDFCLQPGSLGENITLKGAAIQNAALGDQILFTNGVALEITKVRTPCYTLDPISPNLKKILWNRIGMYARVIKSGIIENGEGLVRKNTGLGQRPALRDIPKGCADGSNKWPGFFYE